MKERLKRLVQFNSRKLGIIITAVMIIFWYKPEWATVFEQLERKAYDLRFRIRGVKRPGDKVLIVAIDEKSVEKLGRWPWSRDKWAIFIRNLYNYKPKVIGMDVIFSEPDQNINIEFINRVERNFQEIYSRAEDPNIILKEFFDRELSRLYLEKNSISKQGTKEIEKRINQIQALKNTLESYYSEPKIKLQEAIDQLKLEANTDQFFAQALAETDKVVLGWFFFQGPKEIERLEDRDFSDELELIKPFAIKMISYGSGASWMNLAGPEPAKFKIPPIFGFQVNLPVFSKEIEGAGYFTAISDPVDNIFRQSPMIAGYLEKPENPSAENFYVFPSLSLAVLSVAEGEEPLVRVDQFGVSSIQVGNYKIPVNEKGMMLINYHGPAGTYPAISFYDVYSNFKDFKKEDPEKLIKDKIVLVGATAVGIYDLRTVPFGSMPGIEMHANAIDNIINDEALLRPSWANFFDIVALLVLGGLLIGLLPRLKAVFGGMLIIVVLVGYLLFNYYLFLYLHYSLTLVYPVLEVTLIYMGMTIYHYALEEREKRFIHSAFSYYMSPAVIAELLNNPEKLKLGGEKKEVTAFFSDIKGFSKISEKMSPEELVHLLNHYLTELSNIIFNYEGTIDKFEGDAVMAFFGAPIDYPDHPVQACLCALDIQKRLEELNQEWKKAGKPELYTRIGLNTGFVVVGNMGSEQRMDYTIMGDEVNLASRLEGANKEYGTKIMISESTYQRAKGKVVARELDLIRVVGKEKPVRVYELIARKGELSIEEEKKLVLYQEALELYKNQRWGEAKEAFKRLVEQYPDDEPSRVYFLRCEAYELNPPLEWDGVYSLTKK